MPDAINRKLVSPFQYFGVSDLVDLSQLTWARGGYDVGELDHLYTGNHARAQLVVDRLDSILVNPLVARGIGFCVSVAHAEFMAKEFGKRGIPSEALSAQSPDRDRESVRLQAGET